MAYTPHEWQNDELITAAKLNNIEEGVASGALIVEATRQNNDYVLNKTFGEIYNALKNKIPCYLHYGGDPIDNIDSIYATTEILCPIIQAHKYETNYRIYAFDVSPYSYSSNILVGRPLFIAFQASLSTDYPTFYKSLTVGDQYLQNSTLI